MLDRDVIFGLVAHLGGRASAFSALPRGLAATLRGFDAATQWPARAAREQVGDVRLASRIPRAPATPRSARSPAPRPRTSATGWPLNRIARRRAAGTASLPAPHRPCRRCIAAAMRGRFSCVSTSITPSTGSASLASMRAMRPLAMVDATTLAMGEAGHVELAGIFRCAGDLGAAVDAGCGGADVSASWTARAHRDFLVGLRLRRAAPPPASARGRWRGARVRS